MSRGNRSQQSHERTEQERERDRLERARRRAARAGEPREDTGGFELPAGEPSQGVPEPAELLTPGAESEHAEIESAGAAPGQPEMPSAGADSGPPDIPSAGVEPGRPDIPSPTAEPPPAEPPTAEPPSAEPSSAEPPPELPSAALPITEPHAAEPFPDGVGARQEIEQSPVEIPRDDPLAAAGSAAAGSASGNPGPPPPVAREPPEASSPPAPAGRASASVRPGRRSPTRRRSLVARAGALLALAVVIAAVWLLIDSLGGSGHAGPVSAPAVVRVVIPEGETRLQIARIAAADGLTGSYRAASKSSPLLNPAHYGAPAGTPDLEGFLFPATYEMNPGAPVTQLVEEQLVAFKRAFGANMILRAQHLHTTPYRLLIVASMIEREAKTARDRPLIAAVMYNRLNKGIPLGIDATIYYALALRSGAAAYTRELTEAQLHIGSPYNTRVHAGLPPTPISNPGAASIEAAAHPAHVPYLYYVLAADGCGEHVFSTTYAQFERNAAAYRAAVSRNGGQPPTCKAK